MNFTMNKKKIFFAIVALVILSGAALYEYGRRQQAAGTAEGQEESIPKQGMSIELDRDIKSRDMIQKKGFEILKPSGWKEFGSPSPSSVMVSINQEEIEDPEARKINFKTYYSVTPDKLKGKDIKEHSQSFKGLLEKSKKLESIRYVSEKDTEINGRKARLLELEARQRGIKFHIMIALIIGKEQTVWVVSFNTLEENWADYQQDFLNILNTFILK